MSDIAFDIIRIKEDLLAASQFLNEHLSDFENYNQVTFRNQLLSIQSKLSTLFSLSESRPRDLKKFKNGAENLLNIAIDVETPENEIQRVYNIGKLAGASSIYLNEVNSVVLQLT
jgi:hypothetical protein